MEVIGRPAGLAVLLMAALMLAACSGGATSTTLPADDRLLILDTSGNIATLRPDGTDLIQLTDDAGPRQAYLQPTWAPDGERLVYTAVDPGGAAVVVDRAANGSSERSPSPFAPFYYQWSPGGDRLAMLGTPVGGTISLAMLDPGAAPAPPSLIDEGQPYYFHWSPNGDALVVHVGSDRLDVIDPADGQASPLGPRPGAFQAPQWSGDGSALVAVVGTDEGGLTASLLPLQAQANGQRLVLLTTDGEVQREVAGFEGSSAFQLSPDGSRLAYALTPADGEPTLWVSDTAGGEPVQVAEGIVVAFQWSHNGERLLVIELDTENEPPLVPSVWQDDETRAFPAFSPTRPFLADYLPFWDQYARSLTLWSPDDSAFAYPAQGEEAGEIRVQRLDQGQPEMVTEGLMVSWSP